MAISMDLRTRIIKAWKNGTETRQEIADRFDVSLGMVKKLIQQDRHSGSIEPLYHRVGRKRIITGEREERLLALVREQPDATLAELRARLGIDCDLSTIHHALARLGESYKKKTSRRASKTARTSRPNAPNGKKTHRSSTPKSSSSSTKRAPRPT